jgi:hypothetical protein
MLRKKQIDTNDGQGLASTAGMRKPRGEIASQASFEFDESLHTVDSINLHHRHVSEVYDEECDLSVFSESFASTDTYALSDYEGDDISLKEEKEQDLEDDDLDGPIE